MFLEGEIVVFELTVSLCEIAVVNRAPVIIRKIIGKDKNGGHTLIKSWNLWPWIFSELYIYGIFSRSQGICN